jgi:hypothetical protein
MKPRHAAALALVGWSALAGPYPTKYKSYENQEYGISFRYPSYWYLKEGKTKVDFGDLGFADSALLHGVTVATVELPDSITHRVDSFFQVRVDRRASQRECYESSFSSEGYFNPQNPQSETERFAAVRIGAIQFTEAEEANASAGHGDVERYYHTFANGICYEFQLALGWEQPSPDETEDAFAPLKDILATVAIGPPRLKGN